MGSHFVLLHVRGVGVSFRSQFWGVGGFSLAVRSCAKNGGVGVFQRVAAALPSPFGGAEGLARHESCLRRAGPSSFPATVTRFLSSSE